MTGNRLSLKSVKARKASERSLESVDPDGGGTAIQGRFKKKAG